VPQDVHRRGGAGLPAACAGRESPPGNGVQILLDVWRGHAGQFFEILSAEATARGGDQAKEILLGLVAAQQLLEFALHVDLDDFG